MLPETSCTAVYLTACLSLLAQMGIRQYYLSFFITLFYLLVVFFFPRSNKRQKGKNETK